MKGVHPPPPTDSRPSAGRLLGRAPASERDFYLAGTAGRLAERGVLVSTRAPTHASPADTIVRIAASDQVQLIAMTTRGLGGADRLLFGSVANAVLRHAPCPVLVMRPTPEVEPGLHTGADVRPSPGAG